MSYRRRGEARIFSSTPYDCKRMLPHGDSTRFIMHTCRVASISLWFRSFRHVKLFISYSQWSGLTKGSNLYFFNYIWCHQNDTDTKVCCSEPCNCIGSTYMLHRNLLECNDLECQVLWSSGEGWNKSPQELIAVLFLACFHTCQEQFVVSLECRDRKSVV